MIINPTNPKTLKASLSILVKNRRGYQKDLPIEKTQIESFKKMGFINSGQTFKQETYKTTHLADQYYKDMYGKFSYIMKRLQGFFHL